MRPVLVLMLLAGCSTGRPDDQALRERFKRERGNFVWLRDAIRGEALDQVRTDALVWTEPCDASPHGGCGRWVDGRPRPSELARVGKMPLGRARNYLERLDRIGALEVQRVGRTETIDLTDGSTTVVAGKGHWVEIVMHRSGIVPSGATKSIVWSREPPAALVDDTERITAGHGHQCVRLEPDWYIVMEWN